MLKVANSVINASQIATPITFAGNVTLSTGNLVIGTAGKGIDFTATAGTGTSELLADYEEGTFTCDITIATTTGTPDVVSAKYVKVGTTVNVSVIIRETFVTTVGAVAITGSLPYTPVFGGCFESVGARALNWSSAACIGFQSGSATMYFYLRDDSTDTSGMSNNIITADARGIKVLQFVGSYLTS